MSDWKFTSKDFSAGTAYPEFSDAAADIANAKLKRWLNASHIVELVDDTDCGARYWVDKGATGPPTNWRTHTGYVICIEPIEPIVHDTAERFVKDMAAHAKFQYGDTKSAMSAEHWVERARNKLLGCDDSPCTARDPNDSPCAGERE